jgi:hypothetical protein
MATTSPAKTPTMIPAIAPALKPRLVVKPALSGLVDAESPADEGDGDGVVPRDVVGDPGAEADVDELPGSRLEVGMAWLASEVAAVANGESGAAMLTTVSLKSIHR